MLHNLWFGVSRIHNTTTEISISETFKLTPEEIITNIQSLRKEHTFTLIVHLICFLDLTILTYVAAWWVWNEIYSTLVRINEELLERKVTAAVKKTEINDRG
jgi:hypothetical protein